VVRNTARSFGSGIYVSGIHCVKHHRSSVQLAALGPAARRASRPQPPDRRPVAWWPLVVAPSRRVARQSRWHPATRSAQPGASIVSYSSSAARPHDESSARVCPRRGWGAGRAALTRVRVGSWHGLPARHRSQKAVALWLAMTSAAQTREALRRIPAALEEADAGLKDVVRTRMFVTDIGRWGKSSERMERCSVRSGQLLSRSGGQVHRLRRCSTGARPTRSFGSRSANRPSAPARNGRSQRM
jgi:hypothetical protein